MGILRKKEGASLIDYTMLQKKGLVKKQAEPSLGYRVDKSGALDLTQPIASSALEATSSQTSVVSTPVSSASTSPFELFDAIAQTATNTTTISTNAASDTSADVHALRLKIEDLEYKLERFLEKIALIESRVSAFEQKIG